MTLEETFQAWINAHPTRDFKHPLDADREVFLAGASAEREECANCVPTNWLDDLLSGPDAVIGKPPYFSNHIERLLRAVKERIRQRGEGQADGV